MYRGRGEIKPRVREGSFGGVRVFGTFCEARVLRVGYRVRENWSLFLSSLLEGKKKRAESQLWSIVFWVFV